MKPQANHIRVGVGAMVFNDRGEVFLAKRGPAATNEKYYWEFPGGRIEYRETLQAAVRREFREEYGMQIRVAELLGVFDHILSREKQHWISVSYIARHVRGMPRILEPRKCVDIGWFSLFALPRPLSQISRNNFRSYCRKFPQNSQ
jgi:8-oxo-dGTP diphosphatase